jgi:hypothetical protein
MGTRTERLFGPLRHEGRRQYYLYQEQQQQQVWHYYWAFCSLVYRYGESKAASK